MSTTHYRDLNHPNHHHLIIMKERRRRRRRKKQPQVAYLHIRSDQSAGYKRPPSRPAAIRITLNHPAAMTTLLRVLVLTSLVLAAAPRPGLKDTTTGLETTTSTGKETMASPRKTMTGLGKETMASPRKTMTGLGKETMASPRETMTGPGKETMASPRKTMTGLGKEMTTGSMRETTTGARKTTGPGPAVAQRMRLFKTEVIKSRILSEVNLKEPPVVSAPLAIPDNVIHLLESKEVEEAILEEGENLIAYPLNESTSCEHIPSCSRYEFELPSDSKPISSMHIWIRKTAPDTPMDMSVCIATSTDEDEERTCEYLKNVTEVKSEKGWAIYELPRRLVLESNGDQLLCTVDIIGPPSRDHAEADHKPFIVASMTSPESAERKRRSTGSSSGASKNCTCCLVDFYVSFKEIGWHWVVAPLGFNANMCFGKCSNQINSYPTHYHQMLSTILNNKTSGIEKKEDMWTPCCSSTKLSPLNMIYVAGNNTNTNSTSSFIYHKIPNMITESCGCW